ncbi:MAG: Hpt domain-containing protein [Cocleimonas sp.]|nr:Hpt domain-containing protein [Cocleimonas sp.]
MNKKITIDQDIFNTLKENMEDLLPILIDAFLEDSAILLQDIQKGIDSNDIGIISTATHTIKSSAKNIGAEQMASYCIDIEEKIENPEQGVDINGLQQLCNLANSEMEKVKLFLENEMAVA